jgi:MFS transporter, putative signal transducer
MKTAPVKAGDGPQGAKPSWPLLAGLAFAQEVPGALSGVLGTSVFRSAGASLDQLALFALPQIPEALRWLFAPAVDNRRGGPLGARRSWIVACAALAMLVYLSAAAVPATAATLTVVVALLTLAQAVKAVEAVAVDAYTIESIGSGAQGLRAGGAGAVFLGKEMGQLFSLLGLGLVFKFFGWGTALVLAGILMFTVSLTVMLRPEPPLPAAAGARPGAASLLEFLRHMRWRRMLAVVFFANFARSLFVAVFGAFLVDKGLSVAQIGIVAGGANTFGSVLAALAMVPLLRRWGLRTTLGRAIGLSVLAVPAVVWLAASDKPSVIAVVGVVLWLTLTTAPITITLLAARLGWTSEGQTGTDFTIQSSAYLLGFVIALAVAGPIAQRIGWPAFFGLQATLMLASSALFYAWLPHIEEDVADWRQRRDGTVQAAGEQPPERRP